MKRIIIILVLILSFNSVVTTFAQTPEITNGLFYLASTENPDGSWGGTSTSINTDFSSTAECVEVLRILNENNTQAYINAVQWLSIYPVDNAGYIAWKILALHGESADLSSDLNLLLQWRNEDSGWGGYETFFSNNFHTSLALQALKAVNYPDQNVIYSAINYLTDNQNADGGWGFYQGDESSVYMTALVLKTLQQFPLTTDLATAINKSTSYLIAHQNIDGGFGPSTGSGSTVYETALAYIALVGVTTDSTVLGNAINYLNSTQLPNGSWNDDPLSKVKPNLPKMSSKEFNKVWRHIV